MKMNGEKVINASKQDVWDALNNPEKLKLAIPGAETVEKKDDNNLTATVKTKIGPISAKFTGNIILTNVNPPNSYTLTGEGTGGAAGFAKGSANVELLDVDDGTLLKYNVDANVGGKLAQIGQRLIETTANKLADDFFGKFNEILNPEIDKSEDSVIIDEKSKGLSQTTWITILVILTSLSLLFWYSLS
tara:strand:- start:869 stop:1435 length:567 start_codon:yes stop_codon:yes gene_type:complete